MRKRGSNHNATKFGVFARILLSGEVMGEREKGHYVALLFGLAQKSSGKLGFDCLEEVLVEKLAFLFLRLTRVYKADVKLAGKIFRKVEHGLKISGPTAETEYIGEDKEYQVVLLPKGPSPDLLVRYEANIERQIARTLEQLERPRRVPQSAPEPPVPSPGAHADPEEQKP